MKSMFSLVTLSAKNRKAVENFVQWHRQGGRGMQTSPFWEKIFGIDRENVRFVRKRPPFQNPGDAPVAYNDWVDLFPMNF
jgi:hypothetical protein